MHYIKYVYIKRVGVEKLLAQQRLKIKKFPSGFGK